GGRARGAGRRREEDRRRGLQGRLPPQDGLALHQPPVLAGRCALIRRRPSTGRRPERARGGVFAFRHLGGGRDACTGGRCTDWMTACAAPAWTAASSPPIGTPGGRGGWQTQ